MKKFPAVKSPSTVLLVDDDINFSKSILLNLSDAQARYQIYSRPEDCLRRLNAEFRPDPFEMNWVARGEDFYFEHRMLDIRIPDIHIEVYDADRFDRVSVVVVDLQMPGMNGLELCKSIKNKHIRKILLTGYDDKKLAIEALNSGVIHQYIEKHDPRLTEVLNEAIRVEQHKYFCSVTAHINDAVLVPREDTALSDEVFIAFLEKHAAAFGSVENYLCGAAGSFLFVNARGDTSGVYVSFEKDLDSVIESARDHYAPDDVIQKLRSREWMLCYHSQNGHGLPHGSRWERYLFPITKVEGKQTYFCAVGSGIFDVDRDRIKPFLPRRKLIELKPARSRIEQPLTSVQTELHS